MIKFSSSQLDKLADYFMDVAKALTLAALAVPLFTPIITLFSSLRIIGIAMICIYASLYVIEYKEVLRP